MADNEEVGTQKTSKYNSGIAQIYRLDNLWKDTHRHARALQFSLWNLDLDRVWCELAKDLEEQGKFPEKYTKLSEFDNQLANLGPFIDSPPAGWQEMNETATQNRAKQYKILLEKELFLRRLENEVGKGTAWDDASADDWE